MNQLEHQVVDTCKLNHEDRHLIEDLRKAKELLNRDLHKTEVTNKLKSENISKLEVEI